MQEPTSAPSPIRLETSTARALRKRKGLIEPSVKKISQNFHNFVELASLVFKTLAEVAAYEKACENALVEIEERKKLLS